MITGVGSVAVLVHNAKKSAAWYRDNLGFEIVGSQGHTVFVKPRGAQSLMLHLCERCDAWEDDLPGGRTGIWLQCGEVTIRKDKKTGRVLPSSRPEDVESAYHELKKKGVKFSEELTTVEWGKYAILRDLDGNEFEMS
ncbi:MAG: VOC family protein [Thaumarchaeota archaeon]|nr:VOC family protein [Nitrososphaerota archaeon]